MKKLFFALLLATTTSFWSGLAYSAPQTSTYNPTGTVTNVNKTGDVGLGVKWGNITGVTGKWWTSETTAWDGTVAFENGNTAVGVDHLWHFRGALNSMTDISSINNLVPYLGLGLMGAFGSNTNFFNRNTDNFGLAARVPLGVEFLPQSVPLGIFGEVAPGFGFVPTNYTFLQADLGARYYF